MSNNLLNIVTGCINQAISGIILTILCSTFPIYLAYAKDIIYIDKRVRTEPQEYAIVFAAYDGEFGHAFVTVVWGDEIQNATLQKGVGFYPQVSDSKIKVGFGGQGFLTDDTWQDGEVLLSVLVNKEYYDAANAVIEKWEKPQPYFLGINDCTTFVKDVAEAVGLVLPSRLFSPYPINFLNSLIEKNG